MALEGSYLGMDLVLPDNDPENLAFFEHCGRCDLHLQRWRSNGLLSYPPGTASPWDGSPDYEWARVEGRGTVMSYCEVHHAILPAYRDALPYLTLLVELDTQRGEPTDHEALRMVGNLVLPDGTLATSGQVKAVGIGTRVRIVYVDVGDGFALPQWTVDPESEQPTTPWRYAQE